MSATKQSSPITKLFFSMFLAIALVALVFSGQAQANKNKGGDDIILYNGNIVLRGGGGKGKGKGGGNIVVANSQQGMEMMPMFGWGEGFGRRRR